MFIVLSIFSITTFCFQHDYYLVALNIFPWEVTATLQENQEIKYALLH